MCAERQSWLLLALACSLLLLAAGTSWGEEAATERSPSSTAESPQSPSRPNQTSSQLEQSLSDLRAVLDDWATDSEAVSKQLEELLPIVDELRNSSEALRTRCEESERSRAAEKVQRQIDLEAEKGKTRAAERRGTAWKWAAIISAALAASGWGAWAAR